MSIIVCGSFAYDHIMSFPGSFKSQILSDNIDILNVCFMVPDLRREFGGCAGNIAFNLALLDADPIPMGTVGEDARDYFEWLDKHGINRAFVCRNKEALTAQAFITTDLNNNQITIFHSGAMELAHQQTINDVTRLLEDIELGIISPDGRDAMLQHASQFVEAGIRFIFDPGQGLPMFSGDELRTFISQASWVTVNEYEWKMLQELSAMTADDLTQEVEALIVTRGDKGSLIYTADQCHDIPSVRPLELKDPTGCGDAYRAGLLYGLKRGIDWQNTGQIASLLGAIKIEHHGTQNHTFTMELLKARYEESFATAFP